jgi:hypothetical protein
VLGFPHMFKVHAIYLVFLDVSYNVVIVCFGLERARYREDIFELTMRKRAKNDHDHEQASRIWRVVSV